MNRTLRTLVAGLLTASMLIALTACGSTGSSSTAGTQSTSGTSSTSASATGTSGLEDGVLTVAMECAYAPYNWTQSDDSNGAVQIKGSSDYANGYDVMMAKKIADALGVELEIVRSDWDSLVPAVQSGTVDAVIAGQSMTQERSEQVDFAGPYFYASIVCLVKSDSPYAQAKGLSDLAGATCTAQIATIWYDTCLPQVEGVTIQTAAESAPAMLMALETGTVDFVCTDMPTAQGAVQAYPDMVLLDFSDSDDNFVVDEGDINIGISMRKGNTELKEAIDGVLADMTADDFNDLMAQAISVQPISEG
ncbi:transporter substrate-binding domain-containing protein [uncultured Ruthenibacterium sp.]|uniref:transporter substrate-binding domain-containing protein n=1 Tax=uncultured Ruthenibacterium sp. TaxID=1905347 RepID=UPI00349EE0AE